eukprot:14033-Heterococcus_DN1.PRE.3
MSNVDIDKASLQEIVDKLSVMVLNLHDEVRHLRDEKAQMNSERSAKQPNLKASAQTLTKANSDGDPVQRVTSANAAGLTACSASSSNAEQPQQTDSIDPIVEFTTTSLTRSTAEMEYDRFRCLNGVRIEERLQEREWARLNEAYDFRKEEELLGYMRHTHTPCEVPQPKYNSRYNFELKELMRLFESVSMHPDRKGVKVDKEILQGRAVELATEVCNSNTAEKLMYVIQQLMLKEQNQKHEPLIGWPPRKNPRNTIFYDLEAWAVKGGDGTVTVDTDKLQAACDYVKEQKYHDRYHWAHMLLLLNSDYFSKDSSDRVNEVSRLTQLEQLASLWDFDEQHPVAECFLHKCAQIDCTVAVENTRLYSRAENYNMILDVALASLTVRYNESVRQQLITRLLVLRWIGEAILKKGVLPVKSMEIFGHIIVDHRPGTQWDQPPSLNSRMVPNYDDMVIRVHNMKLIFKAFDAPRSIHLSS